MRTFNIKVNGVSYAVEVEEVGSTAAPAAAATPTVAPAPAAAPAPAPAAGAGDPIKAPMQGTIVKVNVGVGDAVKKGDVVCLLEAMKMENEIFAPRDGKVTGVLCKQGDAVKNRRRTHYYSVTRGLVKER